ncbi:MAG: hypothetical protein ACNS61_08545 [Candidatus Wenzhouxiangella sp. M2_3B_020]
MTTLSLADLDTRTLRRLGLDAPCTHIRSGGPTFAVIPVVQIDGAGAPDRSTDEPGGTWLRTGLHRLRVPALPGPAGRTSLR